ncbi:Fe-S cluster assembly protein SufB [Candidatus Falkowbacteria bacterium]|nr:Fe-S cluster assembly protein SufB [Candidatus Falkowbacteria bacterium]
MNDFSTTQNRELYEHADADHSRLKSRPGLSEEIVKLISSQKNEPEWMLQKRLAGFALHQKTAMPTWGPNLTALNLDEIVYFVRPDTQEASDWGKVPDEIKKTFERLGIPQAEREVLGGVGAQYDSDVVYHSLKKELSDKGVIFENMDVAVQKYPELVKEYFMTQCVPINDHKFIMIHAAAWSGGTFIYVPKGVKVELPLQAYFRMNAYAGGQFEHTLIIADEGSELHYIEGCSAPRYNSNSLHAGCVEIFVKKNARVRYSSIENWSKNTYNLNTKRALVDEGGVIEWVNGNMGSGVTMLYPASILRGRGARSDSLGIAFAGAGQHQDTGSKVIHVAPETKSTITAKSISKDGGIASYRGYVRVAPTAINSSVAVECDALLLDPQSVSQTYPTMLLETDAVDMAHEARVGKIGDEEIFYLMSRGMTQEQATQMVVAGFIEPIVKSLPLEYALELNKLIELEMEGSVG